MKINMILIAIGLSLALTLLFTKMLIPILKRNKVGQKILIEGPSWHKGKEGTPTMGGIGFILAISITFWVIIAIFNKSLEKSEIGLSINIWVFAVLNALIGIIDDVAKIKKAENKGLSAKNKFILQVLVSIFFLVSLNFTVGLETNLVLPILKKEINLGFFYYLILLFLLCGIVNAVNLTDGLDGLASTCTLTVGTFFLITYVFVSNSISLGIFGGLIIGATVGFLVYNLHPAKVFMGDTGSLFLGGFVVGASFLLDNPMLVLIYGFIFILEALSVILQVTYFKLTKGKRLFKMAPLHHHFEKNGYSEMKIISIFGIINLIFCAFAFMALLLL